MCAQKYAPGRIRFGSRSRRWQRNLLRCVFSRFSQVRYEPGSRVSRKHVPPTFLTCSCEFTAADTLNSEEEPMQRSSRIIMPHNQRHKLLITIVGIILIVGLVVAQGDYNDDPDSVAFPGPSSRDEKSSFPSGTTSGSGSALAKSIELAKEISSLDTIDEFLTMVAGAPQNEMRFGFKSRMGETGERSNVEKAIPAKCRPELQPVPLNVNSDPSTVYFPTCTRVKRCGGCCSHSLLTCQPTASEIRNFEVLAYTVGRGEKYEYKYKTIVPLEEHTKCQCDCRIKAEHCTQKQSYKEDECRCVCNNIDDQEKCSRSNETKIWNPELCICLCRDERECSTGFYFDQNTCRCRQVPISRTWLPPTKGVDYRFGQTQKPDNVLPVIYPLDPTDPRRKPKEDPEFK